MARRGPRHRRRRQNPPPGAVGSLLGYNFALLGDERDITKSQTYSIPGGNLRTDDPREVFRERTIPFSLDSIVAQAATISAKRVQDNQGFEESLRAAGINPFAAAPFLVRRLVTESIALRTLPDESTKFMSPKWFLAAATSLMDMTSRRDAAARDRRTLSGLHALTLRMLQSQYHDQLSYQGYARELWLSLRTLDEAAKLGLDVERMYDQRHGVTFTELAALCFGAWATLVGAKSGGSYGPPAIDPSTWIRKGDIALPSEKVDRFFELCSLDYAEFQKRIRVDPVNVAGYETYALSPTMMWPLLVRTDGLLVAPLVNDVLERGTRTLAVEGLQIARALEGKVGESRLAAGAGTAYERYVGDGLRASQPNNEVLRAEEVFAPTARKCDYVVVGSDITMLVEVKSVRMALKADITKEREDLKAEFASGGIVNGLVQLNESARAIRERRTALRKGSNLIGLLVVRGEQVLLNSDYPREILDEILAERGEKLLLRYQIANDEDFEALVRLGVSGKSIGKWLLRKSRQTGPLHDFQDQFDISLAIKDRHKLPINPLTKTHSESLDELLESLGLPIPSTLTG